VYLFFPETSHHFLYSWSLVLFHFLLFVAALLQTGHLHLLSHMY
jgi:cbb3-type cytochrome oxidase subunit 1